MRAARCFGIALGVSALFSGLASAANPQASRFYEDALKRFESKDAAGAVIQLKNAIQQDRTMLAAQVLLGKALLIEGDPIGAEVAFEKALRLGVGRGEVVLFLGQALLLQGKFEALIARLEPAGLPAGLRRDVLLLRAKAYAEKGSLPQATRSLDEAASIDPESAQVKAAQGALLLRQHRLADAVRLSDEAMRLGKDDQASWELRGSILHVKGDIAGALAAYERLLQLQPRNVEARVARAGVLIDQGRLDEATNDVTEILRIFPRDPRGAYLRALIAGRNGDQATVQESLKSIVNLLDPVPPEVLGANRQMLMLLALAHFSLGNQEKAAAQLWDYLRRYPGEPGAAKLLAGIYLQRNEANKAINLLEPIRARGVTDSKLLSLLAASYMAERRYQQASRLLEEAVKLSGGAADVRAEFGLSLLGEGRSDQGLEYLRQAFAKDPQQTRAGMALAGLLMRRGQAAAAVAVVESLETTRPDDVEVLNLVGGIKGAAGDRVGARRAYERALRVAPKHTPVILNLSRIDRLEGKVEPARARLAGLLRASPGNIGAMMEMAELEEQAGNPPEAIRWLEKARAFPRGAVRAGLKLVDIYLAQNKPDLALPAAKEVVVKSGRALPALAMLARAQTAAGDPGEARQTLGDMTRLANFDADTQLAIARLQRLAGNESGAMYSLDKALSGAPGHLPVQIMMVEIDIARKEFAEADARLKTLLKQQPNDGVLARLQGDLLMAQGQYAAAIGVYRTLVGRNGGEGLVLHLYRAYEMAGERGNGLKALEAWTKTHPGEPAVLRVLGDGYLQSGDLGGARRSYERLLALRPDDPLTLNNLALVMVRQGDRSGLPVAEKAYKLAGHDPIVIDTLGWLLVSQGQLDRGLGYLRDARLRAPGNREIRYHLAYALAKSGRAQEAREELLVALRDVEPFDGIEGARNLQRELAK